MGGKGADSLKGGNGADVFVFASRHGRDTVADFNPGRDLLDLSDLGRGGARRFADLEFRSRGDDLLVDTGLDLLRLEGVTRAELSADDFLF